MQGKEKKKASNITHPPPQDLHLPKWVQWAYPGNLALLGNHSRNHPIVKSSSVDNHTKIECLPLGTPFVVKGVCFDN